MHIFIFQKCISNNARGDVIGGVFSDRDGKFLLWIGVERL